MVEKLCEPWGSSRRSRLLIAAQWKQAGSAHTAMAGQGFAQGPSQAAQCLPVFIKFYTATWQSTGIEPKTAA